MVGDSLAHDVRGRARSRHARHPARARPGRRAGTPIDVGSRSDPTRSPSWSDWCRVIDLRDLTRHRRPAARWCAVQEAVWGRDGEIVPASVLLVSAKRGGILIGAVDGPRAGRVRLVDARRGATGRPTHWSHMLGVLPDVRGRRRSAGDLKLAQRDRALAAGVDLIEWTFDPLQAANAHLNLAMLGGTVGDVSRRRVRPDGRAAASRHADRSAGRRVVDSRAARRAPHSTREGRAAASSRSAEVASAPSATRGRRAALARRRRRLDAGRAPRARLGSRRLHRDAADATRAARSRGASRRATCSTPTSRADIASSISGSVPRAGSTCSKFLRTSDSNFELPITPAAS